MKKIGIIGGLSAHSTLEYYRILVDEYNKIKGGVSSPELVIDSLDLQKVSDFVRKDDWDEVLKIITESAKNLIQAKAEIIIIATNTIHKIHQQLQEEFDTIPIVSIMDATASAIKEKSLTKVGLLGTNFTMSLDFYPNTLLRFGIETIVPSKEDKIIIDDIIWKELTFNIINEDSKKAYVEIIEKLMQNGAQGVILGCTEIPLLVKDKDSPIPVFDTTYVHAMAVLKEALKI
ncbi:MAG: amino acid racemase [Asgard group archaeon]|nr:amino acid racemase [Asgard group archaeon]